MKLKYYRFYLNIDNFRIFGLNHRDPFDRMIISQALADNFTMISKDGNFKNYTDLDVFW